MRIVINTISTKKHSGGALQIAINFLLETRKHQEERIEWYYITSKDVDEYIGEQFSDIKNIRYFVYPTQPDFLHTFSQVKRELAKWENIYHPDLIYTISSPCYFTFKTVEVMRFANAWITNPNKFAWNSMSPISKIRMHIYRLNQFRMLRKARYIVTQSEAVKNGLLKITHLQSNAVKVVPNVLPYVFSKAIINNVKDDEWINVNCAAAPVPHKNLDIIPDVLRELEIQYGVHNVRFHLTIPLGNAILKTIVKRCDSMGFKSNIVNHGRCTQQQLVDVYNLCSICFLPTLLETFSASSLEAMKFGHSIVATDFDFNKEVIRDAGLYYRPMDAKDAAKQLARIIKDKQLQSYLNCKSKERLAKYDDYEQHFNSIIDYLLQVGEITV